MGQSSVHEENQQESLNSDIQWIAGIFDSEGCIASYPKALMRLIIANCDLFIIEESQRVLDRLGVKWNVHKKIQKHEKWKVRYSLNIDGMENCKTFLNKVYEFLICKKERAMLALQILENRIPYMRINHREHPASEKVQEWSRKIRELNFQGVQNPQRLYAEHVFNMKIEPELNGNVQSTTEMIVPSLDWLGGFFDGDGSLMIFEHDQRIWSKLNMSNICRITIQNLVNLAAKYQLPYYIETRPWKEGSNRKPSWVICIYGFKRTLKWIPFLLGHCRAMDHRLKLLKQLIDHRLSLSATSPLSYEDKIIFQELKKLTKRGS